MKKVSVVDFHFYSKMLKIRKIDICSQPWYFANDADRFAMNVICVMLYNDIMLNAI